MTENHPDNRPYWKATAIHYRRLIEKFRDTAINISDNIKDEGDRRYFGSTNDADDLREIATEIDETRWDTLINNEDTDPYAIIKDLRVALDSTRKQLVLATASQSALLFKVRKLEARSKSRLLKLKKARARIAELVEAMRGMIQK